MVLKVGMAIMMVLLSSVSAQYPGCGGKVCQAAESIADDNGAMCCCFTGSMKDVNGNVMCSENQAPFCQGSFCNSAEPMLKDDDGFHSNSCEVVAEFNMTVCSRELELGLASSGSKTVTQSVSWCIM